MGDALAHAIVRRDERTISAEAVLHGRRDPLHPLEQRPEQIDWEVEQRLDVISRDHEDVAREDRSLIEERDGDVVVEHDMSRLGARDDGAEGTGLRALGRHRGIMAHASHRAAPHRRLG